MDLSRISFDAWMELGLQRGFVGPPICYTHDGLPTTPEEDEMFNSGDEPCIHIIRPYESEQQKKAVEENHAPTLWRNPFATRGGSLS
jgi:hypothetical protein